MTYSRISTFVLTLVAGTLLLGTAASAHDNGERSYNSRHSTTNWHDRDDDRYRDGRDWNRYDRDHDRYYRINLNSREYRDLRKQMEREYWRKCSTVAGQRYYDCNPYRRDISYVVGRPVPRHLTVWNMPYSVRSSLPRAYPGTHYVWVDRDILLVNDRDNTILDILQLILN